MGDLDARLLAAHRGGGKLPAAGGAEVKANVATAVLFGAVLLLEPGESALAATVGMTTYTYLLRFWGDRVRLPWYKVASSEPPVVSPSL